MSDLLDEVLRDQSDEKTLTYFKRMIPYVITITVIGVIVMIANNWYQGKKTQERMQFGDILTKIVNSETTSDNINLTKSSLESIITNSKSHIAELAAIELTGTLLENKNTEDAKAQLVQIAQNRNYDAVTCAYARLLWLNLVIDQANVTELEKATIQDYLSYFHSEDQPFFASASIIKALWYIKSNQAELAKDVLNKVLSLDYIGKTMIRDQAISLLSGL